MRFWFAFGRIRLRPSSTPKTKGTARVPLFLEQMTGIEPAYSAWEADTLPLSYICVCDCVIIIIQMLENVKVLSHFFKAFLFAHFDKLSSRMRGYRFL